jgi:3-hydroxyisobutyrate dehydrogenase
MSEPSKNPQKTKRENAAPLLGCYDDLEGSCDHAWALLARGVKDRRSPFHTPGLATVSPEGLPEIRTVVLRGCDTSARSLRFHTDTRSAKITDMQKQPQAALHFYDPTAKIQLRVRAQLDLLSGAAYDTAWDNTRPMSRECYQVTQAPGSPLPNPADVVFDAAATNDGADYFAPVIAHVRQIEWLYLAARGHRRALFDFTSAQPQHSWLVP